MSGHMSNPAFKEKRHLRGILLTSGLLLSAVGILCPPAQANDVTEQSRASSMRSLVVLTRTYALTNYQDTCTENQGSRPKQSRQPIAHSGVLPARPDVFSSARRRSFSFDALVCTSFCFSRPRGRAPPHST